MFNLQSALAFIYLIYIFKAPTIYLLGEEYKYCFVLSFINKVVFKIYSHVPVKKILKI